MTFGFVFPRGKNIIVVRECSIIACMSNYKRVSFRRVFFSVLFSTCGKNLNCFKKKKRKEKRHERRDGTKRITYITPYF